MTSLKNKLIPRLRSLAIGVLAVMGVCAAVSVIAIAVAVTIVRSFAG